MDKLLIGFILGSLFECFSSLMVEPMRRKWRRQCKYDCTTCRVWDCHKHLCDEQRMKDIAKGKKK